MAIARSAAPRGALAAAVAVLAACAAHRGAPAGSGAALPVRRAFEVPGRGVLELGLPPGWIAEVQAAVADAPEPAPPTLRLSAPGGAFVAILTPWWNPGEPEAIPARADSARLLAELARRSALAGSLERELPLEELRGDGVQGFWFASTDRALVDRAPGPDEYRHLLQGAAAVGPLVVAFTLLDQGPGPHRGQLLEVVRGARHVPGGERNPHEGFALDANAPTQPLGVRLGDAPWSVLVDLPGFLVFEPRPSADGTAVLVLGQHPETGVVVSIVVRRAPGALDAAACRDADLARIRAAAPVEALSLAAADGAARARYSLRELRGRPLPQAHAHAWLFRDGACADVHASKAEPGPDDAARLERILSSARLGEDL
jgi:hypothetical protein